MYDHDKESNLIKEWLRTEPKESFGVYCIKKGEQAMQEFVERRCAELGIDYNAIFTCESSGDAN